MYVFRPQKSGSTPACGGKGGRFIRRVGRQDLKAQRRLQAQSRRPKMPSRRRHQLRDVAGSSPASPCTRPAPPPDGACQGCVWDHPEDASVGHRGLRRGFRASRGVRTRLRARLVERRATELVTALGRRQGSDWAAHVLQGGFHANEGMRRILEAFALRPDLERQVLEAVALRARAAAIAASSGGGPGPCGEASQVLVDAALAEAPLPSSSAATSSLASAPEEDEEEEQEEEKEGAALGHGIAEPPRPASPELPPLLAAHVAEAVAASSAPAPAKIRPSWRTRVLRALGLERWCTRERSGSDTSSCSESCSSHSWQRQGQSEEASEEAEAEERALSSKLVAAVRNAERHAELSRAAREGNRGVSQSGSPGTPRVVAIEAAVARAVASRDSRVRIAAGSQIRFFETEPGSVAAYSRSLQTKAFDGPSGHKARRRRDGRHDEVPEEASGESSEDEQEDWEDQCDDIAQLMSQERHLLLWSALW